MHISHARFDPLLYFVQSPRLYYLHLSNWSLFDFLHVQVLSTLVLESKLHCRTSHVTPLQPHCRPDFRLCGGDARGRRINLSGGAVRSIHQTNTNVLCAREGICLKVGKWALSVMRIMVTRERILKRRRPTAVSLQPAVP
jgi:hypothetical protein